MPPDDFNDWYLLVHALATHLVERYGEDEVAQWHFEVWNEMQGLQLQPRASHNGDLPLSYMQLYNASARALKDVSTSLRVGGPATMQLFQVENFIKNCSAWSPSIPIDFITTHLYPTCPECQTDELRGNPDCFSDLIMQAQAVAAKHKLPFLLTEYNNGLGGTNRDDASGAAFLFRNVVGLCAKHLSVYFVSLFLDAIYMSCVR